MANKQTWRQGLGCTSGSRRQVYLILVRVVSVGELPSGHESGGRGESYIAHFLHTLSTTMHGPEEGSAIPA